MAKRKRISISRIVACSRKVDRKENVLFLPREIVANILHWLPADFLYDFGRYVCKTWNEILHVPAFAKSHLLDHEDCSFLIQSPYEPFNVRYVHIKDGRSKVKDLSLKFPGNISGSSDGVLLITHGRYPDWNFYVANPVTMQVLRLPSPILGVELRRNGSNIAVIPETGVSKVVCIGKFFLTASFALFVLTIGGSMSWRNIHTTTEESLMLSNFWSVENSLSIDGVVYMVRYFPYAAGDSIFAVDLRKESTRHVKVPSECIGGKWKPVQRGKNLCCMAVVGNQSMEVRLLKDLYGNEWVKLNRIDLFQCSNLANSKVCPVIWLESQQVLVVYADRNCGRPWGLRSAVMACSLNTGKCRKLGKFNMWRDYAIVHTNSLVRI